jgi:RNA polymerase sigma-70 factor (ECF subfamily)
MRDALRAHETPIERDTQGGDDALAPFAHEALPTDRPGGPRERAAFRALMDLVLDGSEQAIQELQERYGAHIIRAVRKRLPRQLRSKFDSLDFVQDVWVSFFRTGEIDFQNPEHLIAFLTRMARNKVIDEARARLAKRNDVGREERLDSCEKRHETLRLYARDSTPSQAAMGRELWDLMLQDQPPVYREVLTLLRDGCKQDEVARRMNLSRRTVQRILYRALERTRS